jgi:hypothetical protein
MTRSRLFHTSALAAAALLALTALDGCGKSSTAASGDSGAAESTADNGQDPNGYAPTGGYAEATTPSQPAPAEGSGVRQHDEAGGEGGGYQNAGYYVDSPPPPIPQYDQPPPPADGYYWTPGYWGWSQSDNDYYWVPGTWVQPPRPSQYWTPGYWSYVNGGYAYYPGYWGAVVGYYGGVDYGWGYNGRGYYGGRWQNNHLYYNGAANNLGSVHVTNLYREDTPNWTRDRTSYSGGPGGLRVAPTPQQISAARAPHIAATAMQVQHRDLAQKTPDLRASVNHGRPSIVATARPMAFKGPGVVSQVKSDPRYTPPAHIQAAAHPPRPQGHGGSGGEARPGPEETPRAGTPRAETPAPASDHESRPAQEPRSEGHPAPAARPESRPAPESRPETHAEAPRPETHAAPAPRPEERAAPPPRMEARPPAASHPEQHAAPRPEDRKPEDRPHR